MVNQTIIDLLNFYHDKYNNINFIDDDPISVPHRFTKKQDIEIAGFFAAILAWGNRKTIIKNANRIITMMDNQPYDFIVNHTTKDLKPMQDLVHRTFNATDLLYLIASLKEIYIQNNSLEKLFSNKTIQQGLIDFHNTIFSYEPISERTRKHIASPIKKSTCKRLNMYLRWMVRQDNNGVDFGIWKTIDAANLLCPLDVHVENYARQLNLIARKQKDWLTVVELSDNLKQICPTDPIKYDYALFGMGIEKVVL
ncbi:MAG: TIGR02757 family protein [Chitinophagales bacterium]|nr:TIGR02757 family protein [Chitinophagales bacterium]